MHKSIVPCLTEFPGISSLSVHTSIDTLASGASPEAVEGPKLFPYMVSKIASEKEGGINWVVKIGTLAQQKKINK